MLNCGPISNISVKASLTVLTVDAPLQLLTVDAPLPQDSSAAGQQYRNTFPID